MRENRLRCFRYCGGKNQLTVDWTHHKRFEVLLGWYCLVGEIEDRGVNSLFDSKENYSETIIFLQERGDIQA